MVYGVRCMVYGVGYCKEDPLLFHREAGVRKYRVARNDGGGGGEQLGVCVHLPSPPVLLRN